MIKLHYKQLALDTIKHVLHALHEDRYEEILSLVSQVECKNIKRLRSFISHYLLQNQLDCIDEYGVFCDYHPQSPYEQLEWLEWDDQNGFTIQYELTSRTELTELFLIMKFQYQTDGLCSYFVDIVPNLWHIQEADIMVKNATVTDLPQIKEFYYAHHMIQSEEVNTEIWAHIWESPDYHIIIAKQNDSILSSCLCFIAYDLVHQQSYALVSNIIMERNRQDSFIACLNHIEQLATTLHCFKVMVLVGANNASASYLLRKGQYQEEKKQIYTRFLVNGKIGMNM